MNTEVSYFFFGRTLGWVYIPLSVIFGRHYELTDDPLVIVVRKHALGWGDGGETWKWRRRLFVWEEIVVE